MDYEETPCMSYEQIDFHGAPMKSEMKPYKKTVNNGYTIMTQDECLIHDLEWNEKYHNGIIDWSAFKVGKTILFSTVDTVYGCTGFEYGSFVELTEFINTDFLDEI